MRMRKFYWPAVSALTALLLTISASIAFADQVVNDVVAGGNDTITAGGSTTINYKINTGGGGDPQGGCNASDGSPATVTLTVPAAVSASSTSLVFTSCVPSSIAVVFGSNTPGNYVVNVSSIQDTGTGTYNNQANWTLHVNAAPPSDTTPPDISYTLTPASPDGSNGWYKGNVSLVWTVTENESPGSLVKTGCVDHNVTADQFETSYACSATSDGGSAGPVTVSIKRDGTTPSVAYTSANGTVGDNDWYTSDVVATFTATDTISGFSGPSTTQTGTATTSGEGVAVTAGSPAFTDLAGNTAAAGAAISDAFMIDKTAPTVSVTGVSNGATYTLGSVPTAGCSTTDGTSGVATNATLSTIGGPVGSITATCSGATDNAGNPAGDVSATYTVLYNFSGFFRPVDNLPTLNVAKAGSAIPVKFSLAGDQGLSIFWAEYPKSAVTSCDATALDGIEETVTAGGSSLSFDAASGQYNYVWKTDKGWAGTCRTLTVKLADGTIHQANFKFTK